MFKNNRSGFYEIEHTADWALKVWAPSAGDLLVQAARGMYTLMGITLKPGEREWREVAISATDLESLLVIFLSELLYLLELDRLGFDQFEVDIKEMDLNAHLVGAPVLTQSKEIKAVTYHNLKITEKVDGLEVTIVFDV